VFAIDIAPLLDARFLAPFEKRGEVSPVMFAGEGGQAALVQQMPGKSFDPVLFAFLHHMHGAGQ
jgi:hypothetical protein